MSAIAFDTHTFVKDLTQAGMPEPQAEVLANQQKQLLAEQLASKLDIQALQRDIKELESKLTRDIKALDTKVDTVKIELQRDIAALGAQLTIKLGGMLVVGISTIAVLMKLL